MATEYNFYEMWKEFFNQSSNFIDGKVSEDFPGESMKQVLEFNLLFKKILNETTEKYFENVNIPTRTDLANISSLVVNVDAKIDSLEDLVEEKLEGQSASEQDKLKSEINIVKRDVKSLNTKLNKVLTLVEQLVEEKPEEVKVEEKPATNKEVKPAKTESGSIQN
jgi:polyhydroxyalkanoic acid synthase PhaR subunit